MMPNTDQRAYEPSALDENGQPLNTAINAWQNSRKAIQELLGICQGIMADQIINSQEAEYLDIWLRNHAILKRDPDYLSLIQITTDILEDGITTADELDRLEQRIQAIVADRAQTNGFANDKEAAQRIIGACKGITADGRLHEYEVIMLRNLAADAEYMVESPVILEASALICTSLADGILTSAKKDKIYSLLCDIAGHDPRAGITEGLSISALLDEVEIVTQGRAFCFTGTFSYGTRNQCCARAENAGGSIHKNITLSTNYLVIGDLSSRDWACSSFGRKIEKAIDLRKNRSNIAIVSESAWLNSTT